MKNLNDGVETFPAAQVPKAGDNTETYPISDKVIDFVLRGAPIVSPLGLANIIMNSSTPPVTGGFKGASQETINAVNDLISKGVDTTMGSGVRNITQPQNTSQQDDFAKLTQQGTPPQQINTSSGAGLLSILPDGTKVISRPNSTSTELPTIEIQRPGGGKTMEIRYTGKN